MLVCNPCDRRSFVFCRTARELRRPQRRRIAPQASVQEQATRCSPTLDPRNGLWPEVEPEAQATARPKQVGSGRGHPRALKTKRKGQSGGWQRKILRQGPPEDNWHGPGIHSRAALEIPYRCNATSSTPVLAVCIFFQLRCSCSMPDQPFKLQTQSRRMPSTFSNKLSNS